MDDNTILKHHGVKGQRWGVIRQVINKLRGRKVVVINNDGLNGRVNERDREREFYELYKHRDKLTTKQLKSKTDRLRAEYDLEKLVYQKQNEREEKYRKEQAAKLKKRKAAMNTIFQVASAIPIEELLYPGNEIKISDKDTKQVQKLKNAKLSQKNQLKALRNAMGPAAKAIFGNGGGGDN